MNLTTLTSKDFAQITKLLETKESLLTKVAEIDKSLSAFESGKPMAVTGKRTMSPAARARIAAAQKKRWAKINKGKKAGKPVAKKKHKMSAAGRAAIAAAARARWAKIRAEKARK